MDDFADRSLDWPIEVTFAETVFTTWEVCFHTHPRWELIYQRDGVTETLQENRSYMMRPGMILLHPPRAPHRDIYSEDYSIYYIQFDARRKIDWPVLSYDDNDRTIGRLCESIYREHHGGSLEREKLIRVLGIELDIHMRRMKKETPSSRTYQIVSEAKRILEERFASPPTMPELSERLGLSQSTFYFHFKSVCGISPKQYLMSVRMNHALGLIRHTDLTLDAVASSCGFNSASHLIMQVKDETGQSPGSIRKIKDCQFSKIIRRAEQARSEGAPNA